MKGTLFIVSAPSGAGKTSLVRALLEHTPDIRFSVSHTTRPIRPGEQHGQDYHFIDNAQFERMVAAGEFIEHATVFDHHYGTARSSIEDALHKSVDLVLDIDWQGARQVRAAFSDAVGIFILPPSRAVLKQRLQGREQDSREVITRRMRAAVSESSHFDEYDYLVINDVLQTALEELSAIVRAHRLRRVSQAERHVELLAQLLVPHD